MKTETKKYKNGITLVCTNMSGFESVAFNIFVKTGSVNETEGYYGISHYIEHMLFKGTKTRSAYQIAKELDSLGANVNAFTDNEETTYFTKSTLDNLEPCVEILSDMFFNSTFDKVEMKREKKVVCEEIAMYNDDAYSKSELLVNSLIYNGTNYAKDVAGTKQSVNHLTQQKIKDYMSKFYVPENVIIAFCGNITMKTAEKLMAKYFLSQYGLTTKDEVEMPKQIENMPKLKTRIENTVVKKYKDNEQANICISYKGYSQYDNEKFALNVLNNALGRGMSSKLFQRIREKLGLVYSISSECSLNIAGGDVTIHFATSTKNAPLALKATREEIEMLAEKGLTENEFLDAKNNLLSSLKLSYENTSSVNVSVCKNMANYNRVITKEELIEKTSKVELSDVNSLLKKLFKNKQFCISYVGKNTRIDLLKNYSLN